MTKVFNIFVNITFAITILALPQIALAKEIDFSLYPSSTGITSGRGGKIEQIIILTNKASENLTLIPSFLPYVLDGEHGKVRYIDEKSSEFTRYPPLLESLSLIDGNLHVAEIDIAPKQTKKIILRAILPQELSPSDYYFSTLFISKDIDNSLAQTGNISASTAVQAGIATHTILSIEPKFVEPEIITFSSGLLFQEKPSFVFRVKNPGEFATKVSSSLIVRNLFGQIVEDLKLQDAFVLKESTRILWEAIPIKASPLQPCHSKEPTLRLCRIGLGGIYFVQAKLTTTSSSTPIYTQILPVVSIDTWQTIIGFVAIILLFTFHRRMKKYL